MSSDAVSTAAGQLKPGTRYNLTLRHGDSERVVLGAEVRVFEQVERVYDEEGIAIGKRTETHFELTGMHQNAFPDTTTPPEQWRTYEEELTIGFVPADVVKAEPA